MDDRGGRPKWRHQKGWRRKTSDLLVRRRAGYEPASRPLAISPAPPSRRVDAPPSAPSADSEYGCFLIVPLADGHHRIAGTGHDRAPVPALSTK
ncbi:hypothetical protein [Streptomyces iranensis]|uniref:Uncharacterized protein n=1 Tax=Streptomyces iranensis TaxID=576784 RepID=A0A060ZEI5_9ACTN|nr:hypothetical protein [Streptomyces iranensis]MBP2062009.1 hypothetical protein [Streptomyces iranensis]CDR03940.1 predicted protein [Streptomyces iranensis]